MGCWVSSDKHVLWITFKFKIRFFGGTCNAVARAGYDSECSTVM